MQKRLEYNKKDSAIGFVMSLLVPSLFVSIISFLIKGIFNVDKTVYYYIMLTINQLAFFLSFYIYNKVTKTNITKANNINFKINFLQILIVIVIGLVAMYGFTKLVDYFDYLISLTGYVADSFNFLNFSNFGMLFVNILVVALAPAICEELMFRGLILNGLKKYKPVLMIVFCGLMFSIMHLSIEQFIYQFVLGMVMASIVMITGSIVSSMILHFFNNAYILVLQYIAPSTTQTFTPTSVMDHILPFILAIASIVIIYFLLVLLKKCTKNPMYEIFNLKKSTTDSKENINNIENSQETNSEAMPVAKKNTFNDKGNVYILVSFAIGITMWIVTVIMQFVGL